MSTFLLDAIAEKAAEVLRVMPAPTGDLGYGSDLSCADDLTATMDEIPGDSILAVAQSNYRRLRTSRGTLVDAPDDGLDVQSFLHRAMTPTEIAAITGQIRLELKKDDRNETLDVTLTDLGGGSFELRVRGTTSEGPYTLTMALTDSEILLREMAA